MRLQKPILILCLGLESGFAAFEIQSVNPQLIAMGGVVSLLPLSPNPAANTERIGKSIRFDYSRLYGIKGLDCYEASCSWTTMRHRALGLAARSFGNPIYSENTLEFSWAIQYRDYLAIGVAANYFHIDIAGYGMSGTLGLSLGTKYYLSRTLRLAILLQNINRPKIYSKIEDLPESFSLGIQIMPYRQLEWDVEVFKDTEFPFTPRTGVCIKALSFLDLRLGVQMNPDRLAGGFSLYWKGLQCDVAYLHHMVLPGTLYVGCGLCF
jgi:hypothetical protein